MSLFRQPLSRRLLRPSPLMHSRLRPLSTTPLLSARKDTQDKDSLNPQSSEYSKSGSDDSVSANPDAAFNPSKTRPESETNTSEATKESEGNPLDVSPGNPEVSKPRGAQEGGSQGAPDTGKQSGGGRAEKSGGGSSG